MTDPFPIVLAAVPASPPTNVLAFFVIALGLVAAMFVLFLVVVAKRLLHICTPNEVLIFTGRGSGAIIVRPRGAVGDAGAGAGRRWRIPVIERVDGMSMNVMSIDVVVRNAYSAGNIPLQIHAIANVKVHSDPQRLRNAVERFLGQSTEELRLVAQQTLEGALREVLAQMTPEQVNEDRLAFADNLIRSAKDDLDKLGLQLDTLKIQNVADNTGYLDSLGRPAIAQALRNAENAENDVMQEVTHIQALARQRAELAKATAETSILSKRNELEEVRAGLDGEAQAVEREAEVAAKTVRAKAEQALQKLRAQLEQKRLHAEVVVPAEAGRRAEVLRAKGQAAPIIENGKAVVEVLTTTAQAWKAMGPYAREIYVIQHIEEILRPIIEPLKQIEIDEVHVVDRGDGTGLGSYAAAYPQTIATVLRALRETTGIDIPAILMPPGKSTNDTSTSVAPVPFARTPPALDPRNPS